MWGNYLVFLHVVDVALAYKEGQVLDKSCRVGYKDVDLRRKIELIYIINLFEVPDRMVENSA